MGIWCWYLIVENLIRANAWYCSMTFYSNETSWGYTTNSSTVFGILKLIECILAILDDKFKETIGIALRSSKWLSEIRPTNSLIKWRRRAILCLQYCFVTFVARSTWLLRFAKWLCAWWEDLCCSAIHPVHFYWKTHVLVHWAYPADYLRYWPASRDLTSVWQPIVILYAVSREMASIT